jgi:hypothetical protein
MGQNGWRGWIFVALAMLAAVAAQAKSPPGKSVNPANDELLKLAAPERAARLAGVVGNWCIGTETLFMGILTKDPGEGNAYWSLRCADGTSWAVQVDKHGEVTAIDCASFNSVAIGKECFKKF